MSWFKVDDKSHSHPKVVDCGNAAWGLFCRLGAWSSDHGRDGFVTTSIAKLYGTESEIANLLAANLLHEVACGFMIHDFLDWNPSAKHVASVRKERANAGSRGGNQKASKRLASAQPFASRLLEHVSSKTLPRPDPVPIPIPSMERESARGAPEPQESAARELLDMRGHPEADRPPANHVTRAPMPPSEKAMSGPLWREAFEAGASAATGRKHSAGPRFATDTLEDVVNKLAPSRDVGAACAWIQHETEAYARMWDGKTYGKGITPDGLRNWLNDDRRPPPDFARKRQNQSDDGYSAEDFVTREAVR